MIRITTHHHFRILARRARKESDNENVRVNELIEEKTRRFKKYWSMKRLITRRERLKSALYLRLKKRKTFFFGKKLEIFEKNFLSENVPQCRKMLKGDPF